MFESFFRPQPGSENTIKMNQTRKELKDLDQQLKDRDQQIEDRKNRIAQLKEAILAVNITIQILEDECIAMQKTLRERRCENKRVMY